MLLPGLFNLLKSLLMPSLDNNKDPGGTAKAACPSHWVYAFGIDPSASFPVKLGPAALKNSDLSKESVARRVGFLNGAGPV
jgi:hypothetical protein